MLGRKEYTREEFDHARAAVERRLAAHRQLATAVTGSAPGAVARYDLAQFETLLFDNMTLVLDRHVVHRLRVVTGKDTNPLNEVDMICDSLMNHDGVLRGNSVIKRTPDRSVLKLRIGDPIRLTAADFQRLSTAFFAELERRFL